MSKKEELSKKIDSLKLHLNDVLADIDEAMSEQEEIEKEERLALNKEIERIVERMNEHFNSDDRSIHLKVRAFCDQQQIIILQPDKRVAVVRFYYDGISLEEIKDWADRQIASLQFYRLLVDQFGVEELYNPIFGDRFAIEAFDDVSIHPTYDPDSGLVTLEIRSFLSLNSINKILNKLTDNEITFNNLSNVDEDDRIVESVESYTCYLNEMISEIKAIREEYTKI